MNTMTLQIELPAGVTIDQQHLQALAAGYIQRYVYRMQKAQAKPKETSKSMASFRKLRGVISSEDAYEEVREAALKEKYGL